ncbi:efflux RND transporter periplasmic adaptor subunit [Pedobacter sp. BAL39]|uniref:efflux RND transporter periplasmic adaptor subunit n=1 Tax=Pedobacter sp. BAL39 TaxID=391596 RepID=UPI00058776D0|nr:efflux RND transporter periplasmic adaptor subunit [Pedobacter sp. BAL39]
MERKLFLKHLAVVALLPSLMLTACSETPKRAAGSTKKLTYTCPMHPQVIKEEMGSCPICGMDLVLFEKNSNEQLLVIDQQRQALANITTAVVGESGLSGARQLNGRLVVNPEASNYISSRIAGRVEQLYIRETGVMVKKGQPLYQLYSEELATLQQEYLMAAAQEKQFPGDKIELQLLESAKQKLLRYGQSQAQVVQLLKTQKKSPMVTFFAPQSGIVAELAVNQGQYVTEGASIMRLEGYDTLWVEADLYPNEAAAIQLGQQMKVVIPGWEDQPQLMKVSFINPSLQSATQLSQIRGSIPNVNHQWQPGAQANVFLPQVKSAGGLSLPEDAVIQDGKAAHIWVKTGKDHFEPRKVRTGTAQEGRVLITEGLENGTEVVMTGAYLLYSEYVLKKGKNPV